MVGMRNVVAITSAKVLSLLPSESFLYDFAIFQVPIVKLIHQQCQIEADLSLYNVLARENTCLLSLYAGDRFHINMWMIENSQSSSIRGFYVFFVSDLDPRVRTLGYMVKLFAKVGLFFAFILLFQQKLPGLRYRGRQQRVFVIICLHSHDDLLFASKDDATIHLLVFITKRQDKNHPHEVTVIIL